MEIIGAEDVAHGGFDEVPERRVGREKVAGSSGRFDHWSLVVRRWSFAIRRTNRDGASPVSTDVRYLISLTSNQ